MRAKPVRQGLAGAVGQDVDALAGLGVDEDGGIAVASAQGEVVHAQDPRCSRGGQWQVEQQAQGGGSGGRGRQEVQEPGAGTACQFPDDGSELGGQPAGAALVALEQARYLLAKGLPRALQDRADQASHPDHDHHPAAVHRHVRHSPLCQRGVKRPDMSR